MRPYLVLLVLWCGTVSSDEFHSEKIAPGDIQHLKQAILDANGREMRTALALSGTYTFTAADELPAIRSTISMWGDRNDYFRFQGASEVGPNRLLTIESDGELTVGYGEFTKFDVVRVSGSISEGSPLIENHGSLVLDQAVLRDINGSYFITRTHFTPPLISNFGSFLAKRSSFINSRFNQGLGGLISNLGFACFERSVFDSTNIREPISNEGEMELVNVSYLGNPLDGSGASSPLSNGEEGTVRIGNSVFAGVEGSFLVLAGSEFGPQPGRQSRLRLICGWRHRRRSNRAASPKCRSENARAYPQCGKPSNRQWRPRTLSRCSGWPT